MISDLIPSVLGSLERQCAKREYCQSDIRRKATKLLTDALSKSDGGGDYSEVDSGVEEILSHLVREGYVDDARYARAFASDKSSLCGWGSAKIRFALRTKGIAPDVISAALSGTDSGKAAARLSHLLGSKWKTLKDDPFGKFKLIKYALSRGYEYGEVEDAVDEIIKGDSAPPQT